MNHSRASFFAIAFLLAAGASAARAGVSTESPFAPRGFSAAGANMPSSPIELRGVTSDEQGLRFAIYDPAKKEGSWVHVDEKINPFVVRSYEAETGRIIVDYQGRSQTLTLIEPKFGPGKAVAMAATPVTIAQPGVNPGASPAAQPQNADDAKRLEAIRAEIARRRAQRDAAAQQQQAAPHQ